MRQSFGCSLIVYLALALWNRRKSVFFLLNAFSLAGNLISLLSFLRCDALASFRTLLFNILPGVWRILCSLVHPPYLYILLNLILITVVVKSGILTPGKEENNPKGLASKIHRIASWRSPLHDLVVEEPVESNRTSRVETQLGEKRQSLFIIEPLEIDQDVAFLPAASNLDDEYHTLLNSGTEDSLLNSTSVPEQHLIIYDQKPDPSGKHAPTNDPSLQVPEQIVLIEESNPSEHPDQQLVQIGEVEDWGEEISRQELNRRADAYIKKVRQNWWLQRQDSFNRLYGLISGDSKSR